MAQYYWAFVTTAALALLPRSSSLSSVRSCLTTPSTDFFFTRLCSSQSVTSCFLNHANVRLQSSVPGTREGSSSNPAYAASEYVHLCDAQQFAIIDIQGCVQACRAMELHARVHTSLAC